MEPEGSVPRSQQPTTCPYPEPREFSVRCPILSVYNQFQYYVSIHFYSCRGLTFLQARTKAYCLPQTPAALSAQALEGLMDTTATHTNTHTHTHTESRTAPASVAAHLASTHRTVPLM